ncbi:hypothetical protein [Actinoplanes sp. NPDC026670]|uniref:hypothetical protein n=1 Tax=Actinoplanes sp. NPDC026670 TaxID=3154700 RepID=UPI003406607E
MTAAKAVLTAGVSFAASIATILGVIGLWQLGERVTLWGLVTLCVVVALTLATTILLVRAHR